MNEDNLIEEYKKTWEQVTLVDSSRARMEEALRTQMRVDAVFLAAPKPSPYTRFFQFSYMPVAALVVVVLVGVGALQANPSEGLTFSERIGRAFGIERFYQTRYADISETSSEAPETVPSKEEGEATGSLAFVPPSESDRITKESITTEDVTLSMRAMPKEEEAVMDIAATMMLADGLMDIEQYRSDVVFKEKTYRDLIKKYETNIEEKTREGFIEKLDTVQTHLADAEQLPEEEARQLLDKSSVFLGEIESELSLMGQVEIENGTIISINFSKQPE